MQAPDFFHLVLLIQGFASGPPPLGEPAQMPTLEPQAMGRTMIDHYSASTAKIDVVHTVSTHRALAIRHFPRSFPISGYLIQLQRIKPNHRIRLPLEQDFQFARIKKQTGAGMTAFDPQRRLKIKLQHVQIRRALRAGKRLHDPQVAKMNLPEIDVGPDSAKRTKGHRPLQAAATLQTFHRVKIRTLLSRSMTQIPTACRHQGSGMPALTVPVDIPLPLHGPLRPRAVGVNDTRRAHAAHAAHAALEAQMPVPAERVRPTILE